MENIESNAYLGLRFRNLNISRGFTMRIIAGVVNMQKLREGDIVKYGQETRLKNSGERGWKSEKAMRSQI
jgi:hypothetical protein